MKPYTYHSRIADDTFIITELLRKGTREAGDIFVTPELLRKRTREAGDIFLTFFFVKYT